VLYGKKQGFFPQALWIKYPVKIRLFCAFLQPEKIDKIGV
jgi:hypothetical protein